LHDNPATGTPSAQGNALEGDTRGYTITHAIVGTRENADRNTATTYTNAGATAGHNDGITAHDVPESTGKPAGTPTATHTNAM